jgi:hypothetical protein
MHSSWTEIVFLCDKVNIDRLCINIRFQKISGHNIHVLLLLILLSRTRKLVIRTMHFYCIFSTPVFRINMDLLRLQFSGIGKVSAHPAGRGGPKRIECKHLLRFLMDWITFFWQIWGYFANNYRGPRFVMYRGAPAVYPRHGDTFCCRVIWTCTNSLKFFLTITVLIMSNIHNTCRHSLILFPLWFSYVAN